MSLALRGSVVSPSASLCRLFAMGGWLFVEEVTLVSSSLDESESFFLIDVGGCEVEEEDAEVWGLLGRDLFLNMVVVNTGGWAIV